MVHGVRIGNETPILDKAHSKDTAVQDFTTEIMAQSLKIELNHTMPTSQEKKLSPAEREEMKQELLTAMCIKLAVIGIDIIKN
jgi:hypothetical protein